VVVTAAMTVGMTVGMTAGMTVGDARPAGAGVSVASDGARVTVSGYRAGGEDHAVVSQAGPGGRAMTCRELIGETNGIIDVDGALAGRSWPPLDPHRQARWRYWLDCRYLDGTAVALGDSGLGYVYVDEIIDYDVIVRTLAERYLAETAAPDVRIGTAPTVGLVGVEQWFWVDGATAVEGEQVHDVLGRRVVLRLEVGELRWSFGDGRSDRYGREGLGVPGSGAVTHRYRDRSTAGDPAGAYPVTVEVAVRVRYTLDGGPWLEVPSLTATGRSPLVVREAQAVGHR